MADVSLPGCDWAEWLAMVVLGPHGCGDQCICQQLRQNPSIQEAIRKIGAPPPQ